MDLFKFKNESDIDRQLHAQANKLNISVKELKNMYAGKSCPKYGSAEILHVRKVRGGKTIVFNISEKFRGEKISATKKLKDQNKPIT